MNSTAHRSPYVSRLPEEIAGFAVSLFSLDGSPSPRSSAAPAARSTPAETQAAAQAAEIERLAELIRWHDNDRLMDARWNGLDACAEARHALATGQNPRTHVNAARCAIAELGGDPT